MTEQRRIAVVGMTRAARLVLAGAGVLGAVAVAFGAYAAHGFQPDRAEAVDWMRTGSTYQLVHALAAVAAALMIDRMPRGGRLLAGLAAGLFLAGAVLFPGALYALAFGGAGVWGMVAPLGGMAFILGWLSLALTALRGGGGGP